MFSNYPVVFIVLALFLQPLLTAESAEAAYRIRTHEVIASVVDSDGENLSGTDLEVSFQLIIRERKSTFSCDEHEVFCVRDFEIMTDALKNDDRSNLRIKPIRLSSWNPFAQVSESSLAFSSIKHKRLGVRCLTVPFQINEEIYLSNSWNSFLWRTSEPDILEEKIMNTFIYRLPGTAREALSALEAAARAMTVDHIYPSACSLEAGPFDGSKSLPDSQ